MFFITEVFLSTIQTMQSIQYIDRVDYFKIKNIYSLKYIKWKLKASPENGRRYFQNVSRIYNIFCKSQRKRQFDREMFNRFERAFHKWLSWWLINTWKFLNPVSQQEKQIKTISFFHSPMTVTNTLKDWNV